MCDCYMAKCPACKRPIDMHLADFATGRREVRVHCCLPSNKGWAKQGVLWLVGDRGMPLLVFVRPLTANARRNWSGNHPNAAWTEPVAVFGKVAGVMKVLEENRGRIRPDPPSYPVKTRRKVRGRNSRRHD